MPHCQAEGEVKRCEHGFLAGKECPECHPELYPELVFVCAICEGTGHVAKYCHRTVVGRNRRWGHEVRK